MSHARVRDAEILAAIKRLSGVGFPPTVRELCDDLLSRSTNGMQERLVRLERKGLISRRPKLARSIVITPDGIAAMNEDAA